MSLNRSKILFCFLLSGLISCGQDAIPQTAKKATQSSLIESGRVSPSEFDLPMHLNPVLSGSFGELRYNHFHSGIDFKTQYSVGYPIYAVADGWVSRIRISNYGFGYALYLDHPNGFTTVYGHLQKFAPTIAAFAKKAQYELENFEVDTLLKPLKIPVKRGQIVAYSGDAGSSGAPHLHFEIRDTKTEETIDPLLWYSNRIKDTTRPQFKKIALYASKGEGALNTGDEKHLVTPVKNKQGTWVLNSKLPTAWGKIGIGMNAYDYMDGTSNTYGICNISLYLENELIFQQDMSRFSFSQTRYINSLTDFELREKNGTWIMKSFLEPENKLKIYLTAKNRGYIDIREEKVYHFRYEIKDRAGNASEIRFEVQGQKKNLTEVKKGKFFFEAWLPNQFSNADIQLDFPAGTFYQSLDFQYAQKTYEGCSDVYELHHSSTPMNQFVPAKFRIQKDIHPNKEQYYLAKQDKDGRFKYVGGTYFDGWIKAKIRDLGNYTVLIDTVPPKIVGLNLENAVKNRLFRIRISDEVSGVKTWRGTIDGAWVLFEFDCKTSQLRYNFDDSRLSKGAVHKLVLTVKDACGNESCLERHFNY